MKKIASIIFKNKIKMKGEKLIELGKESLKFTQILRGKKKCLHIYFCKTKNKEKDEMLPLQKTWSCN
jgi:hypothetical protein